jgi:hypothetical protein
MSSDVRFLPGVPAAHILQRLSKADGDEIGSGKLASAESSAALAVNTFGWFIDRCDLFPAFPSLISLFPARFVDVEYCARFPWTGGRHPWLDAIVKTDHHLIGVESKRFEPFRDEKHVSLSKAYDRDEWGHQMAPFTRMRDALRSGEETFHYLDAAQLVKHALGLLTDAKRPKNKSKSPVLIYLFAEPKRIKPKLLLEHRSEIARFADRVKGAEVAFHSLSYQDWLSAWPSDGAVAQHRSMLVKHFAPW